MSTSRTAGALTVSFRTLRPLPSLSAISNLRFFHCAHPLRDAQQSPSELRLRSGLKEAMKARDKPLTTCLKVMLADITNAAKASQNPGEPLSESGVIIALRKGIKDRKTASESYAPSSPSQDPDLHSNLQWEISLLQEYLPSGPSTESLRSTISEVLASLSEETRGSRGVMGEVKKGVLDKLGDGAKGVDRKEVGRLVAEVLKGR